MPDVASLTALYNARRKELGAPRGEPISHRAAARLAGDEGKHETFRQIGNGTHTGRIDEETVDALIKFGLSERAVRRAAGHQTLTSPGAFVLPARANRLTQTQRRVVLSVIDAILSAAERPESAPAEPPASPGLRAVARKKPEK